MQAIAKMTTSVALVSVRPPASRRNGNTSAASAASTTGECSRLIADTCTAFGKSKVSRLFTRSFEALDAFAEQAARPHEEHQQHQQIHRRLRCRREEVDAQSAHDADDQCRIDDAPERAKAADHDDDERG